MCWHSITVSTHSRPKAAGFLTLKSSIFCEFQHTAARRRLGLRVNRVHDVQQVSTHSRPKAAGPAVFGVRPAARGFNTQPPEGGWVVEKFLSHHIHGFQHTAARRRLALKDTQFVISTDVSTHSRPKAAGLICHLSQFRTTVSTHSRPKAAGMFLWRIL